MVDDLSCLELLDEEALVTTLRRRYEADHLYTYIGDIIVAVNPYKTLHLFDQDHHEKYKDLIVRSSQPPHLFWVADRAYRSMLESGQQQCILVSGESGSGKTECTKYIISHLMKISPSEDKHLLEKIVLINPLLEAFGNASTLMNNNSSRFGKYIEIHYKEDGSLLGAKIDDYILEKCRVAHRSTGERNFHIFYALFAGMSRERLLYYFLEEPDSHRIMVDDDITNGVFRDPQEFQYYRKMFVNLTSVMYQIGLSEEHLTLIFLLLSAILHMTNIVFMPCAETDGVSVSDEYPLHAAAKLLGIDNELELTEALISNVNFIKGERIQSWKSEREANAGRDALAKELYSRLFGWIVGQVNRNLWSSSNNTTQQNSGPSIGLLDMSGFENFTNNGFEQFLINVSNEKLQRHFMDHIFPHEKREYEQEGIVWKDIYYTSNDDVINLLFRRPEGIFALLDEESNFPKSTDETLVQKLTHYCSGTRQYISKQSDACSFSIVHYAEQVSYNARGFLEKNRDTLSSDLLTCLLNSQNEAIQDLFSASISSTGTISDFASTYSSRPKLPKSWPSPIDPIKMRESLSRKASYKIKRRISGESFPKEFQKGSPTVSKHFRRSLADLMTKLTKSQPMFIRCIKPNQFQKSNLLNTDLVRNQLRCNGLFEIAHLRKLGYPVRIPYDEFTVRYADLCDNITNKINLVNSTIEILKAQGITDYEVGKSKVFLKFHDKDILDNVKRIKENEKLELQKKQVRPQNSYVGIKEALHKKLSAKTAETRSRHVNTDLPAVPPRPNEIQTHVEPTHEPENTANDSDDTINKESVNSADQSSSNTIYNDIDMQSKWRPYDTFQVSERHFEDNDAIFKEILKVVRLIMYFFLCVGILCGAVASKLSLLVMASGINKTTKMTNDSTSMLLICLCAPIAWSWLMSTMKSIFGGKEWPSMTTFFLLLVLECLQTFGMCLLLFRVLRATDIFRGAIVTYAVCLVPSLLKVIIRDRKTVIGCKTTGIILCNIFAFLIQGAAIPLLSTTDVIASGNVPVTVLINGTQSSETTWKLVGNTSQWELPVALVLISIGWWENFVSGDWAMCGRLKINFRDWRSVLQDVRETSTFLIAPVKIGLAVLLANILVDNHVFTLPVTAANNDTTSIVIQGYEISYSLMYLQLGSGLVVTYFAGLACKLHMQKTAFAIPLCLAPPMTLMFIFLQCQFHFMPDYWYDGKIWCPEMDIYELTIPLATAGALWISYLIIVSHVWRPKSERMAKIEKMFITPHYDGIFPDYSLTMRRRQNDKEVCFTHRDQLRYIGEEDSSYCDQNEPNNNVIPMVYVCATMWHETQQEMTQLMKSLFRLDYVHCASKLAQEKFGIRDPDYFDMEIHIIFDDAFELDPDLDKYVPNSFVNILVDCMEEAARSVVRGPIDLAPPVKYLTPYGGKLEWTMPGQTKLHVHIKDKNKIRHRKRWSQVMYFYYLLGYKLFGGSDADDTYQDLMEMNSSNISGTRNRKRGKKNKKNLSRPLTALFTRMRPEHYEKAENTFILTLDGDVDFRPDAVKLLIDRMKKNRKVGAVCGRIHPIGSGPMVWYQQFEYAIGHWLQKAAEHVFGCVLCCPGCFSLFRGSAIMDDNVIKRYTTKPTEASHYIQFEQGEDRWLCTLLLQQGHRIDYCAGADALTFCPETFQEFFNQRRRWSPSTLANMMDLLSSWRDTIRINDNISRPYVLYQFILMASTILAPSTIILMITGSYHSVLQLDVWTSYFLSVLPVGIYIAICMLCKSSVQITAAAVLTAIYSIVMMIATVGTIISIVTENFGSPNVIFMAGLVIIFVIAGILHPQELFCLVYGVIYFMTVPSTFILLTVFYLCNLNNVSWGTREIPKKLNKEEQAEVEREQETKRKKKETKSWINRLGLATLINEARELIRSLLGNSTPTDQNATGEIKTPDNSQQEPADKQVLNRKASIAPQISVAPNNAAPEIEGVELDPDNPYWSKLKQFGRGKIQHLDHGESEFWKFMIWKYLHPLDEDKSHKEKIRVDLISIRNNVVFIYFMINFLWTIITLQLQSMEDKLKDFYIIQKYEPLSLLFLAIFFLALLLQFGSMFVHRWGTFLHLMSSTRIDWFYATHTEDDFARFVVQEAGRLQTFEPEPDYDEIAPDYDDDDEFDAHTISTGTSEQYDVIGPIPPEGSSQEFNRQKSIDINRWRQSVPQLQQIFERRLTIMQKKWENGTISRKNSPLQRADTSRRYSQKHQSMRKQMFDNAFRDSRKQEHTVGIQMDII